jgi:predicted DNA-binding transcriptional regulator AlpA
MTAPVAQAPSAAPPTPRFLGAPEVAAWLGLSVRSFRARRPALEAAGFPRPHPVVRRWDRAALDAWADAQMGRSADAQAAAVDSLFGLAA